MKIFRCFLLTVITILLSPVLNAQDITGDWYAAFTSADSAHMNLHIYRDHNGLKATYDWPDVGRFGAPIDEITFEKDTLFFQISALSFTYKGYVNQDYSIIYGGVTRYYSYKYGLDFGRKKLMRIIPVNWGSSAVVPAKVKLVKTGNLQRIPYTGMRVVKAGIPKVIEIDTSELKVLTPGKGTVLNPMVLKFPEPIKKDEHTYQYDNAQYTTIVIAKQSEPISAQPMRMKDAACLNIKYLGIEQGLNDPEIWSILEDTKGNMWFGSYNKGVCKYDGKSLTYYTISEGLTNNLIQAMIEDKNGNIWIGTGWGLCKYDGKSFTQYWGEVFNGIKSILESRNGNIWVGGGNGVFVKKGNFWIHYTENEGLINNTVMSIVEDKYGNLWFGTEGGLCKYDGASFTHFTENNGLISNVKSAIEDKYGNLWFGTMQGVIKYDGKSFRQFTTNEGLSNNNVSSIKEDNIGNLWFGTLGGGVNMYDGNTFTHYTTKEGLSNNAILSVIEDKSKNIWITTSGSGVMKFQRSPFTYFTQLEDIGKGKVTSIMEGRDGNIWFGIFGLGLIKYDGESYTVMTENEGLNDIFIRSILKDKSGNIWFANNAGLQKYDGNSVTQYSDKDVPSSIYINCMYEDKKRNIWLGTMGEGLRKFDGESFTDFPNIFTSGYPTLYFTSILQDNNEDIWFGTLEKGIFKYDGDCITRYNINEGLSSMWITSIFEDKTGNLWIGTRDGGVNKFDGQSFTYYTEKEGLSNNSVSSIIEDKKENIWIGTKKGLSMLSPRGDGSYSITSFGTEDGLKELSFNENSVCLDSLNRLWWGTGDIITMLDLNTFEIIPTLPEIQLNNIQINQRYVDFRTLLAGIIEAEPNPIDTIARINFRGLKFSDVAPFYNYPLDLELPHYLNHVTFNFSAVDWTAPQSIRYQYMLDGMDEQWSPLVAENQADYRNIPSGKYTFKVKAISKANIWSGVFEYPFIIHPPIWFRWWAFTIYAIALILLARYYIRFIISKERIKAEVQIKQVEVDKMQELDEMKSRFFANISHEFRTPLTLLLGPINDLLKNRPRLKEDDRKLLLGTMKRNVGRLQQLINQLLDLSKLEIGKLKLEVSEGNLTGFIRTIVLSFLSLAESKRINYEYDLQDISALCFYDEDKIEKIMMNLISNALKFTPEGGSVMVTLRYSQEKDVASGSHAEIKVKDSGPGIPDEEKEKIFDRFYQVSSSKIRDHEGSGIGLALTRELVELYRGDIHVDSEVGKGSTFTVTIPFCREHFRENEIVAVSEKPAKAKFIDDHEILVQVAAEPDVQKDTFREEGKDKPVILIVEDNTDLRKYISQNLFIHYKILEAENGKEGLKKAIESIPDLVISDLMMPEMDGVEMCGRLKEDTITNHIPLIMLTAKADRESKLESLETGADDYIIKPFDAEELQVRVKNLIEQRKKLRERYRKEFLIDPIGHEIPPPEDEFLVRVKNCLKKHLTESEFNVESLGNELGFSRSQLYKKILALTDYTPSEFIRNIRLKMAARMFLEGHRNVTKVLYTVGFNTPSYFTQSFKELFGLNPSDYIKKKCKTKV